MHNNVTDKIIHKIIISSKQVLRKEHGRTTILIEQNVLDIDLFITLFKTRATKSFKIFVKKDSFI